MSDTLNEPSVEVAARILSEVPFADRLPAGRFRPPVGILQGHVRSLSALFLHLAPDPSSLPGVSLKRLPDWIEQVVGDAELAGHVREATAAATCHVNGCLRVYELVGRRLDQAERVMATRPAPAEEQAS
jgi:hypothetical protein